MNSVERATRTVLNSFAGIVIFIVSILAFYLPYEIRIIPAVENILPYIRSICGGLLIIAFLFLYCSRVRVFRDNWYLWAALAFFGILVLSTKQNDVYMEGVLSDGALTGIFFVLAVAVFFKVNLKKYLLITFFIFLVFCIANTYTVWAYYGVGMWVEWQSYRDTYYTLIGNYNGGIEIVIPMAICG